MTGFSCVLFLVIVELEESQGKFAARPKSTISSAAIQTTPHFALLPRKSPARIKTTNTAGQDEKQDEPRHLADAVMSDGGCLRLVEQHGFQVLLQGLAVHPA